MDGAGMPGRSFQLKWRDVDLSQGEVLIASGAVRVAGRPSWCPRRLHDLCRRLRNLHEAL